PPHPSAPEWNTRACWAARAFDCSRESAGAIHRMQRGHHVWNGSSELLTMSSSEITLPVVEPCIHVTLTAQGEHLDPPLGYAVVHDPLCRAQAPVCGLQFDQGEKPSREDDETIR